MTTPEDHNEAALRHARAVADRYHVGPLLAGNPTPHEASEPDWANRYGAPVDAALDRVDCSTMTDQELTRLALALLDQAGLRASVQRTVARTLREEELL